MLRSFPATGPIDDDLAREGYILASFNGQEPQPVILESAGEIGTLRISTLRNAISPTTRNFNLVTMLASRQVANPLSVVNDVTVYGFHAGYTYTFAAGPDSIVDSLPVAAPATQGAPANTISFALPENTPEFVKKMAPGRNPLCKTVSGTIMGFANFVFLIVGMVIAGASGFGIEYENKIKDVVPKGAVQLALAIGILLCFVALLGFAGAWLSQYQVGQKMLTLYALLMAILFLLVVIAGAVLVAAANNLTSDNATVKAFMGDTFVSCCTTWENGTKNPLDTPELATNDWYKITDPAPCWVPTPNCNNKKDFTTDIANWLQRQLKPIGGSLIFLAVLLFLTIIGSCFISKTGRKQMLQRIQELTDVSAFKGGAKAGKSAAPYANMP